LGTGALLGPPLAVPVDAVAEDERHARDRLDVVDRGRAPEQPVGRGERRPQARLAPTPLERVEQRGLLATDVGAGAAVEGEVEPFARAEHVGPEVAALVGLADRARQLPAG